MAKDKKPPSMDELLQQSITDDTSDEDSDEDISISVKPKKLRTKSVEDLLDGYDDNLETKTTAPITIDWDDNDENAISDELVNIQLSKRQRDILAKQDVPELSQLLAQVDVEPLAEEDELKDSCVHMIKKLRKVEQRRAIYAVTGTPSVEAVNPEEDFIELIHQFDLDKLRKLKSILDDTIILGRVSTAQERRLMVEKYNPSDKTALERAREEYLSNATRTSYNDCVTEADFESVYQSRYFDKF